MSIFVQNITKTFKNHKAIRNISFEAESGKIVGFLGPNGAGKSTTMKIATGSIYPDYGTVKICGYDIHTKPIQAKNHLGYLPEHNPLYTDMYVREYLNFIASIYGIKGKSKTKRITKIVHLVGLEKEYKKKISALSKGYKQRVGLAQAFISDPKVLILDEPTTGLDPNQIVEIRELIRQMSQEKTVILSTHIMQEVESLCDRVIIIHLGKIIADNSISDFQKQDQQTRILVEFETKTEKQLFSEHRKYTIHYRKKP